MSWQILVPTIPHRHAKLAMFSTADCCTTPREPWPGKMPDIPSYPWLEVL